MKFHKRTWIKLALFVIFAMSMCSCSAAPTEIDPKIGHPEITEEKEGAFVTIDINPSIELVLDKEHTVTSVGAANSDAEVLLWHEDLVGLDLNTAVERITGLAIEMGYLNEENTSISVTVTTDHGKTEEKLLATIDETMDRTLRDAGLEVRVEEAVDLVLSKELADIKEQNAGKPGYDETLTLSRYRLVKSAMRADRELTMDEAVLLSNEELTETVSTAQATAEAKFGEACELTRTEAEFVYENAKLTMLDSAYTAVYTARRDLSSLFGNYGAAYAGYRLAYRTIEHYAQTIRAQIDNPTLTSDDVFALANALGIDTSVEAEYDAFKQEITDENGKVTKDRVNAYINRQYQNMPPEDRAQLEKAYNSVLILFDRIGADASIIREDGQLLISGTLFGLGIDLSVETYEDLPALLEAIQKKIDDTFARMEEDLTENEKARVTELQEEMTAKIAELEKEYEEAVAEAQQEAESYLNEAKEAKAKENHGKKPNGK